MLVNLCTNNYALKSYVDSSLNNYVSNYDMYKPHGHTSRRDPLSHRARALQVFVLQSRSAARLPSVRRLSSLATPLLVLSPWLALPVTTTYNREFKSVCRKVNIQVSLKYMR